MPILTDGLPYTGFIRDRKIIYELLTPTLAKNYATKISQLTGVELSKVIRSQPFINYLKALFD